MMARKLLLVCSGNLCRSPMAEYLLKRRLGMGSGWEVVSAGLSAGYGVPASPFAVEVLKEEGIDMSEHRSRPADRELIDSASLIVVMTASHREQIGALDPAAREKVFLLRSFDRAAGDSDVEDPIGSSVDTYRRVRDDIKAALPELISFMETLEVDTDRK